jgi:hypothetical protein
LPLKAAVPAHAQRMSSLLVADKEFAPCRESKGGRVIGGEVRAGRRERGYARRQRRRHMHGARLSKGWGPRARAERTLNIQLMSVTLEMSKLSGWLKADACCRVKGRACDAGGERWEPGGGRAWGAWWRHTSDICTGSARLKAWGPRARAERTRNILCMVVTLEVSKLSGWLKALADCAESKGGHAMRGGEVRREAGGPGVHGGSTQAACTGKMARLKAWGPRARAERTRNM